MARTDNTRLAALEAKVAQLTTTVAEQQRVQTAALQRVTMLPQAVQQLLAAEHCSQGSLTGDGQGMVYEVGGIVNLTIFPFADRWELRDATGKMQPLRANFGKDADFSPDTVLRILGFVSLAQREDLLANAGYWAQSLNTLVAPPAA